MKTFAIIALLVILAPIIAFGQAPGTSIQIETFQNSKTDLKSTDIRVIINGDLQDNGIVKLFVNGKFSSDNKETYSETFTFSQNNPTHVFELDYPFLPNEKYLVSVSNGWTLRHLEWIPLIGAQEKQSKEPSEQVVSQTSSNNIEAPVVITKDESASEKIKSVELVQSMTKENEILKQEVSKKNAVIMEQVKVIQSLANQINNAMYDKHAAKLYFVADTSEDLIKTLTEENEFLKQEVSKKNAVIMEQIKVIQSLASQIGNTIYEDTLAYSLSV